MGRKPEGRVYNRHAMDKNSVTRTELSNVENQDADEHSVLNWFRTLIGFRRNDRVIRDGEYRVYNIDDPNVYEYTRLLNGSGYHILCSFCKDETRYVCGFEGTKTQMLFSNYGDDTFSETGKLRPFETVISKAELP